MVKFNRKILTFLYFARIIIQPLLEHLKKKTDNIFNSYVSTNKLSLIFCNFDYYVDMEF